MCENLGPMTEGLLTIAYGPERYVRMARALSLSYRRYNPTRPLAVVTDETNSVGLQHFFDLVIPLRSEYGSGVVQKLHADRYSPFERTLFVDSDCLFYKTPQRLWDLYAHGDFSVRGWRYLTGESDYEKQRPYEWVEDTSAFLQRNNISRFAHFNSGVFYFTRSDATSEVFTIARSIYERRASLGFVPFKNGPMSDEPAFAVAMERTGIEMDPWDSGNGMETAMNIQSVSEMNVLNGSVRFRKLDGVERSPTLVHFNVDAQDGMRYAREMLRLKYERRKLGSARVNAALLMEYVSAIPKRFRGRGISGVLPKFPALASRA